MQIIIELDYRIKLMYLQSDIHVSVWQYYKMQWNTCVSHLNLTLDTPLRIIETSKKGTLNNSKSVTGRRPISCTGPVRLTSSSSGRPNLFFLFFHRSSFNFIFIRPQNVNQKPYCHYNYNIVRLPCFTEIFNKVSAKSSIHVFVPK
jgi:hypothetical protein